VYAELDRMHGWRDELDPDRLRALAARASAGHAAGAVEAGASAPPVAAELAAALENDLQPAALSLRPELGSVLDDLRAAGALGALVSGSGPTCFGLFANRAAADSAAAALPGALVAQLRTP
jgi:4-diphosphocytidyl-2-C-methyl-D-erythritol kinase